MSCASLTGCADDKANESSPDEPSSAEPVSGATSQVDDLDLTAELSGIGPARPIASCERNRECQKSGASEQCVEAAKACVKDAAERSAGPLRAIAACRESAVECSQGEGGESCRDEFKSCVKAALTPKG